MEIKLNSNQDSNTIENNNSYQTISNSWNIILDFLDINSIFQIELSSKYFRNRLIFYYESKENILKNLTSENNKPTNEEEKKEYIINFKKKFLSNYFNLLVNIDISNSNFHVEENTNNNSLEIIKRSYGKLETMLYKRNKIMIGQIFMQGNNIFILYNNNTFSIMQFDTKENSKNFEEIFSHDFLGDIITNFKYYENQGEKIILFLKKNSAEFFYLNLNEKEKNIKKIELNKEYKLFKEESIIIKEIFIFNEFFLFFTNKDEFILIPNDLLKIFNKKKIEEKSDSEKSDGNSENSDEEDSEKNEVKKEKENDTIPYPQKLENNYGTIKYINSNNINVVFINNEYQIYSIPASEIKNYKKTIPKFKIFSEQKFPNFYTMSFSNNSFLLLEKTRLKPLEEWNTEEIYKWFEEMELDDYLNIIKYQKITGKDIVNGGKVFLLDVMGLLEDHINKLNYEIGTLKYETSKDMKLWAWGNNKNGQLGLMNNQTFAKLPTLVNLPNMMNDDTIEKIFCYKSYSILLTKFGNIFVTGKYTIKEQINNNKKIKEENNKKNKGKNKHKEVKNKKGEKKDKKENNEKDNSINNNLQTENKWINLSKDICYTYYDLNNSTKKNLNNDSYFKIKEIFGENNNIFLIGFYSNKTPFFAIQRKPKFKHLKKGGKFITSDKVIEHIQEFLKDKMDNFKIVYGDSLLKMLETNLPDYLESEVPFHKIIQIKENNEVIWDRKKRYFKENFFNDNINKYK